LIKLSSYFEKFATISFFPLVVWC